MKEEKESEEKEKMVDFAEINAKLKKSLQEIELTVKILDAKSGEAGKRLEESLKDLETQVLKLNAVITSQINHEQSLSREVGSLVLLPEKLTKNIKDITPLVANELGHLNARINEKIFGSVIEKFSVLQQQLETAIEKQQNAVSQAQEKLDQMAIKSLDGIWVKNKKFLISLVTATIFAIGASALTSYLVTTKYPRFIEITGARDVIVQESKVDVYNPNLSKEQKNKD